MTAVTQLLQQVDASADALVSDLNQLDVAQCDLEQLGVVAAVRKKLTARLACLDADIAHRRAELSRVVGERPVDNAVDPNQQRSAAQEKADIDRAEVLDQFPGVDDATRAGEIPATYADAIARAMKRLSESQRAEFRRRHQNLHELAQSMSLHRFRLRVNDLVTNLLADFGVDHTARQHRDRCVRMWTDIETGMGHIHAQLDPETYARVTNAITKRADRLYHNGRDDRGDTRTRDQLTADALSELILSYPQRRRSSGEARYELGGARRLRHPHQRPARTRGVHHQQRHRPARRRSAPVGVRGEHHPHRPRQPRRRAWTKDDPNG